MSDTKGRETDRQVGKQTEKMSSGKENEFKTRSIYMQWQMYRV